ncbi:unnamed protein product, partial [Oikopleura dioica]
VSALLQIREKAQKSTQLVSQLE